MNLAVNTVRSMGNKVLIMLFLALLAYGGWLVAHGEYYKPGEGIGYYLGLVGGLMMLMLLLYSARKHLRFMQKLGKLKYWFRVHMTLGILGPTLVVFHTTFHLGSINATVAFYCMLLVAGSGLIGRFVYTRIHKGLYGSRNTLKEAHEALVGSSGDLKSRLHFVPKVEKKIKRFEDEALEKQRNFLQGIWYFVSFDVRRMLLAWRCRRYIHAKLGPRMQDVAAEASDMVSRYLIQVQTVAQFKKFEQIFSAWHVLHIPLIYMMVATAIFHVIWVHMY